MACESCGDKPKKCNKDFTKAVIEIDNPEQITLMRKVTIPASMGDDATVPPVVGKYHNVLLYYEANHKSYLYSSDGIPTLLANGLTDYEEAVNLPQINGVTLIGDKTLGELGLKAYVFDTVADMKASTELKKGDYARTLGFHTINDGGSALYKITDSGTANEIDIIAIDSTLRGHLVLPAEVTPEIFGAYGDGTHNDFTSIQACLATSRPVIMTKNYLIDSTLNIGGHDEYSLNAEASVIKYTGSNAALLIQDINGGEIKLGKIIALNGNCIELYSALGVADRVIYTDLSFKRLIANDKCIYIHTTSGGYVSENTIRGGEMTSGNYGVYVTSDPSSAEVGINALHFINMGFEGTSTNYYFNAISNYIRGITFTNDRFVEYASTSNVLELHGNCQRFTMNTWSHLDESRLVIGDDAILRRLTLNCPIYATGTTTIYADGIFFDGTNKIYIFKPPYNKALTNNTGVTGNIKVYKIGNICTINFNNVTTTSASMDLVTTDHPVEYLPEQSMYSVLTTSNGSATARVWIRSNGSIAFATQSANIGEGFYGELTYTTLG